jgi:hypothetical protein
MKSNNCIDNNVRGGDCVLTGSIHPTHAWKGPRKTTINIRQDGMCLEQLSVLLSIVCPVAALTA